MNWFVVQVKYSSQEIVIGNFDYYSKILGIKVEEFYYPVIESSGKKILILPRFLFVKAEFSKGFNSWEEDEVYIQSLVRTKEGKETIGISIISDQEMINFKNGVKKYEIGDADGFTVGKKIIFRKGPFAGYSGMLKKLKKNMCVVEIEGFKSEHIPIIVKRDCLQPIL